MESTIGQQAQDKQGGVSQLNLSLNEETITHTALKELNQPFAVVASFIEMLDRSLYRMFDMGLQPIELVELLDAHAQRLHTPMGVLYDQLPLRYQQLLGTRDVEHAYRMELVEILNGDMQAYPHVSFSPNEWHELIVKHPDWAERVPTAICQTESFYYPLRELLPAKQVLRERVPEGFLDRPQFQTEAIVSGFVSIEELGDRLLAENTPYVSVAQYASLSDKQRRMPEFAKLAYGAVLFDAKNVLKVPDAYLTDVMIRHTACCDFELLKKLPYTRLLNCPISDELLCMAIREQIRERADVIRIQDAIPRCYRTGAVDRQLQHIAKLYGMDLTIDIGKSVKQARGRGR